MCLRHVYIKYTNGHFLWKISIMLSKCFSAPKITLAPAPSPGSSAGAIAGGVVAGLVTVLVAAAAVYYFR